MSLLRHGYTSLRRSPALGSVLARANAESDGVRGIVLSDSLWRRRFGADPAIVGRVIRADDTPYRVVGVMPADFVVPTGDDNPQAWLALLRTDYIPNERSQRRHHVWVELAPGRTLAQAQSELDAIAAAPRSAPRRKISLAASCATACG